VDSDSPDYFKVEHYRRIAVANEMYKERFPDGGQLAGWKSDRGRLCVLFGPPDSAEARSRKGSGNALLEHSEAHCPSEIWRYYHREGIAGSEAIDFEFVDCDWNYRLLQTQDGQNHLLEAFERHTHRKLGLEVENLARTEFYAGPAPAPKVMFKDLEAPFPAQRFFAGTNRALRLGFQAGTAPICCNEPSRSGCPMTAR
jgi:GWxTD domain-containing protein